MVPELPTDTSSLTGGRSLRRVTRHPVPAFSIFAPEGTERLHRERDVPGGGALDDRALPRGQRREHQRAVRVVFGRRDRQLPHERSLGLRTQQAHRRQDNVASTTGLACRSEIDPMNGGSCWYAWFSSS